ncbi:MAG: YceI family protein [Elusimicrobiota bacterium]
MNQMFKKMAFFSMGAFLGFSVITSPVSAEKKMEKMKTAVKMAQTGMIASVDVKTSSVKWLGKKVVGTHNGTIGIKEGSLNLEKGQIVGGSFTIDMTSIACEDLKDAEYNGKLVGHLKSADFFSVDKFPMADFKIKSVTPKISANNNVEIMGDLTIKGITKPLTFPASVSIEGKSVKAKATAIAVDRTAYDIKYGSGKFFQNLGDKMIDDQFWLDIEIMAGVK